MLLFFSSHVGLLQADQKEVYLYSSLQNKSKRKHPHAQPASLVALRACNPPYDHTAVFSPPSTMREIIHRQGAILAGFHKSLTATWIIFVSITAIIVLWVGRTLSLGMKLLTYIAHPATLRLSASMCGICTISHHRSPPFVPGPTCRIVGGCIGCDIPLRGLLCITDRIICFARVFSK